ncbi:hypothetical protein EVAR_66433_1 [Eumeta japonica]|uniref:Uncharacterized protein n=1 Tax=Eumeta variegata TaxID=151549 RepID=A0A4C1ZJL6_EUMVA|nr:hypothetical protein EVAR_66433_1 [Eumeta japonica]
MSAARLLAAAAWLAATLGAMAAKNVVVTFDRFPFLVRLILFERRAFTVARDGWLFARCPIAGAGRACVLV